MNIIKIREITGLSRNEFSEKYRIPYRTLQNWELGTRECPGYVLELLEFKVKSDFPQA